AEGEDFTRHDKWLCMMYPRLVLLRQLLSEKGAIFISIDDNEVSRLRTICDDIFGANCFKGDVIWHKTYSPRNDSKGIPTETDHILVYSKSKDWLPKRLERDEEMDESYKNPDNDFASWTSSDPYAPEANTHQGMVYAVQSPFTGKLIYPTNGRHWATDQDEIFNILKGWCEYELRELDDAEMRAEICGVSIETVRPGVKAIMLKNSLEESREKAQKVLETGPWPRFYFTKNGQGGIRRKTYLTAVEGKLITTFWDYTDVGHTDAATKELKTIFGGRSPFETPKPSSLIERIVQVATDEDSIVLDAFAGSGSSAHAVLSQNSKDKGSRKFVLVELMDYAEDITAERVRRVMAGYPYKGKVKEELYCKPLTAANLAKVPQFLAEANSIREANADRFTKIAKPTVKDNAIVVIGELNVDGTMPGLGGGFDFYELGEKLFTDDDTLNENVGEAK
ncbi:MAG: site-specific DNA-methyltransferase, partial [Muribaculaceae bacterium]|nr:site-specific DNA-methyltransferase [Muribaculaceae bacterium]